MIRLQEEDFDVGLELAALGRGNTAIGGVCSFIGYVRDEDGRLDSMTLEHYPAMTEKALLEIEAEAKRRWQLAATVIIHRTGRLRPGDQIVMVAAAAAHRGAAFEAARFLIDWLKTKAPFWKNEERGGRGQWVEAKVGDATAAGRWEKEK
jgi:molybdopterin synthase catalytic subunit